MTWVTAFSTVSRRGAGVGGADGDGGRGDLRVAVHRQDQDRQQAEQADRDGDHPGKDRPVDEETNHARQASVRLFVGAAAGSTAGIAASCAVVAATAFTCWPS
jgi:hypothetical protein